MQVSLVLGIRQDERKTTAAAIETTHRWARARSKEKERHGAPQVHRKSNPLVGLPKFWNVPLSFLWISHSARHVPEDSVQVCSNAENDGDDCDRNAGRDEAILDGGRGVLVAAETSDPFTHCLLQSCWLFYRPREQARYDKLLMGETSSDNLWHMRQVPSGVLTQNVRLHEKTSQITSKQRAARHEW
jgi:hypothetical protein